MQLTLTKTNLTQVVKVGTKDMKITIALVAANNNSVAAAIEAKALKSDSIASGIIGPSFSTSGPGPGWSKNHDASDFARRALSLDYGADSYIDSDDGREATLKEGKLVWTDNSVIELQTPSLDEALEAPAAYEEMAKGAKGPHAYNVYESEWADLARKVAARSPEAVEAALKRINGTRLSDGSVVYYDDGMGQHYLSPEEDLHDLAELMMSDDEDVARDAYSHWCAGTSHPECDDEGSVTE